MKLPGPDHPITISANPNRVHALFRGHLLADTGAALTLREAGYKPVQYIPRDDAAMVFLTRTDHHTYCPYKGEASYFSIIRDGEIAENAVWSYEDPYPAVGAIKDYLGFYPNQVEVAEGEPVATEVIREIVEHTDTGSGRSQLDHWPPNVSGPAG
jgi:uncharacterized protein (DUF427 family)